MSLWLFSATGMEEVFSLTINNAISELIRIDRMLRSCWKNWPGRWML